MYETLETLLGKNGLLTAFAVVGATMWLSYWLSDRLTRGRIHGSAIAILAGLVLAYVGGVAAGGKNGLAEIGRASCRERVSSPV